MVALAVTVLLGVTFRFAGSALVWYDEVAAVQLAWITYYGSAYAALKGSHISVPSIFKAFPLALRKIFFVVSKIVVYGFLILLAYLFVTFRSPISKPSFPFTSLGKYPL